MRPDGSGQMIGGWICLLLSVLTFVASLVGDMWSYSSGIDFDVAVRRWMLICASGGALSMSGLFFATSWIIHAISFLPGRDEPVFTTTSPTLDLTPAEASPTPTLDSEIEDDSALYRWIIGIVIAVMALFGLILMIMNAS